MSADQIKFTLRFNEHEPTCRWNERKFEIAAFIALCWAYSYDTDIYRFREKAAELHGNDTEAITDWLESESFSWREVRGFFELEQENFTGRMDISTKNMVDGLKEFYPDIDYEFHDYQWWGSFDDYVSIGVDGKTYEGHYKLYVLSDYLDESNTMTDESDEDLDNHEQSCCASCDYAASCDHICDKSCKDTDDPPKTIEDVLALPEFKVQKATEDNPYPIPEAVLDEEADWYPSIKWFVPQFK